LSRPVLLSAAVLLAVLLSAGTWWAWQNQGPRYTVEPGDTLWAIAKANGVSVADLRAWNGLSGDHLDVGDVLRLGPTAEAAAQPSAQPATARKTTSKPRSRPRKRPPRKTVTAPADPDPAGLRGLVMPSPEACVPFTADPGDEGMVAPEGLSVLQARQALNPVLQVALACPRPVDFNRVDLLFELGVGCNGVVDRVDILSRGQAPAGYAQCVADVLAYADFPAHDLPDGDTITYPVTVAW
jgi:murein DD-endopeptidase MepM/ murein hydrolase activator NlpD